MSTESFEVTAFYRFIKIPSERVPVVRKELESFAERTGLRGLVVLGTEGINSTCAGTPEAIQGLKAFLKELFPGEEMIHKGAIAQEMPFARFKVDVRPEIVTIHNLDISDKEGEGTHLSPSQWHEMIANDPDVVLVDTRNDYETEIGVFEGAIDPKISKFSEFKNFVEAGGLPKDKKLFLYCTGGIRCEKAVPEVMRLGFKSVYQLEGGILKYLEEYPEGYFKGECFVFDRRIAVDKDLQPTQTYSSCPHCGFPAKERISCGNCGCETVICHHCIEKSERNTCSKNCKHHFQRKARKSESAVKE
jgi:UPF0176 protein